MKGDPKKEGVKKEDLKKEGKVSSSADEKKEKMLSFLLNPIFLIIFSILILAIILFTVFSGVEETFEFSNCGDGTFSGYCSLSKPYFCLNETLVENEVLCGCSESFNFNGVECVSEYDSLIEEKYFDYILNGENGTLYFKSRALVLNELLALPRYQVYFANQTPRRDDFALKKIDNPLQTEFLSPLVIEIQNLYPVSKDMQAKVAVSLVQNIHYNESQFISFFGNDVRVSRYPYQVLSEGQGECEGKSELLAFFLKEMGYGVVLFYYPNENHEAVGIKCPIEESYLGTGYCFVETTMPSPISFSEGRYLKEGGIGKLSSEPEIILINEGMSLGENLEDYKDSKTLSKIIIANENNGGLNSFEKKAMDNLRKKYGLQY
ncbi:MAG: hypothetical protein Q8Q04_01890 [archaeon]|nr:hypothetical protein [archaeon]